MVCSKRVFVARTVLKTAVVSKFISFNDGEQGLAEVFKKLDIEKGEHAGLNYTYPQGVQDANRKSSKPVKNTQEKASCCKERLL